MPSLKHPFKSTQETNPLFDLLANHPNASNPSPSTQLNHSNTAVSSETSTPSSLLSHLTAHLPNPFPNHSQASSHSSATNLDLSNVHSASDPSNGILMQGYLSKEGMKVKNWKLRFVRLFADALAYYAVVGGTSSGIDSAFNHSASGGTNTDSSSTTKKLKLKKLIKLQPGQLVAKAPERALKHHFCFKFITHERCYYFVAPNEALRSEWIHAIKDALLRLQNDQEKNASGINSRRRDSSPKTITAQSVPKHPGSPLLKRHQWNSTNALPLSQSVHNSTLLSKSPPVRSTGNRRWQLQNPSKHARSMNILDNSRNHSRGALAPFSRQSSSSSSIGSSTVAGISPPSNSNIISQHQHSAYEEEELAHASLSQILYRFPKRIQDAYKEFRSSVSSRRRERQQQQEKRLQRSRKRSRKQSVSRREREDPKLLPLTQFSGVQFFESNVLTLRIPGTFYIFYDYLLFYSKIVSKETIFYFHRDQLNYIENLSVHLDQNDAHNSDHTRDKDSMYAFSIRVMDATKTRYLFSIVPSLLDYEEPTTQTDSSSSRDAEQPQAELSFDSLMKLFKRYYSLPVLEKRDEEKDRQKKDKRKRQNSFNHKNHHDRVRSDLTSVSAQSCVSASTNASHVPDTPPESDDDLSLTEDEDENLSETQSLISTADAGTEDSDDVEEFVIPNDSDDETERMLSSRNRSLSVVSTAYRDTTTTSEVSSPTNATFISLNIKEEMQLNNHFRNTFNPLYKQLNHDVFVPNLPEDEMIQFRFYCSFEDPQESGTATSSVNNEKNQPPQTSDETEISSPSTQSPFQYGQVYITPNYFWFQGKSFLEAPIVKWALPFSSIESLHYKLIQQGSVGTIKIRVFSQSPQGGNTQQIKEYNLHLDMSDDAHRVAEQSSADGSAALFSPTKNTDSNQTSPWRSTLSNGERTVDGAVLFPSTLPEVDSPTFLNLQELSSHKIELKSAPQIRLYRILVHVHNAYYETDTPISVLFPHIEIPPLKPFCQRVKLLPEVDGFSSLDEYSDFHLEDVLNRSLGDDADDGAPVRSRGFPAQRTLTRDISPLNMSGTSPLLSSDKQSRTVHLIRDYFSIACAEKRQTLNASNQGSSSRMEQTNGKRDASPASTPLSPQYSFKLPEHCSLIDHFELYCYRTWGKQRVHLVIFQNFMTGEMKMQLTPVGSSSKKKHIKRASFRDMSCVLRDPKVNNRFMISFVNRKKWKFFLDKDEQLQHVVRVLDRIQKQAKEMENMMQRSSGTGEG